MWERPDANLYRIVKWYGVSSTAEEQSSNSLSVQCYLHEVLNKIYMADSKLKSLGYNELLSRFKVLLMLILAFAS